MPNSETEQCEKSYNKEDLEEEIYQKCLNNSYCTIDSDKFLKAQGNPKCISPYAQFYMQVYCMHSEEELNTRDWLNMFF